MSYSNSGNLVHESALDPVLRVLYVTVLAADQWLTTILKTRLASIALVKDRRQIVATTGLILSPRVESSGVPMSKNNVAPGDRTTRTLKETGQVQIR